MKRILSKTFVLIVVFAMMTSTVLAGSALELVGVEWNSSGPTFTFRVVGEFSKSELNSGFVQVEGGDAYPLYCAQQDSDTVVCHTTKKVAGQNVVVGFGGASSWIKVPDSEYCYKAWDWTYPPSSGSWSNFATHCQGEEAQFLDSIVLYNPEWDGTYTYFYYDYDAAFDNCGDVTSSEGGYYYPECP